MVVAQNDLYSSGAAICNTLKQSDFNAGMEYALKRHTEVALAHWEKLCRKLDDLDLATAVDGHSLDIATVVAVARFALCSKQEDSS